MLCESCADYISFEDYEYLDENTKRDDPNVFIFHKDCDAQLGYEITEVIEEHGELKLVRVRSL